MKVHCSDFGPVRDRGIPPYLLLPTYPPIYPDRETSCWRCTHARISADFRLPNFRRTFFRPQNFRPAIFRPAFFRRAVFRSVFFRLYIFRPFIFCFGIFFVWSNYRSCNSSSIHFFVVTFFSPALSFVNAFFRLSLFRSPYSSYVHHIPRSMFHVHPFLRTRTFSSMPFFLATYFFVARFFVLQSHDASCGALIRPAGP